MNASLTAKLFSINLALFTTASWSIEQDWCRIWPRWSACDTYGNSFPNNDRGSGFLILVNFPQKKMHFDFDLAGTGSVENFRLWSNAYFSQHLSIKAAAVLDGAKALNHNRPHHTTSHQYDIPYQGVLILPRDHQDKQKTEKEIIQNLDESHY